MLTILAAHDEPRIAQVRGLFAEYAAAFDYHVCFEGFQDELARLPGEYAPPTGCLLLAEYDGRAAGCVALRRLGDEACEMKRLYVRPAFRGLKIGRALAEAILEQAAKLGYRRIRLDTLPAMERARALYTALGFQPIEAYYDHPDAGAVIMERPVGAPGTP